MKILKNAEQKNVIVDKESYTDYDIKIMFEGKEIFFFDGLKECYDIKRWLEVEDENELRIFLSHCDEMKVKYNKIYGYYETVTITKEGREIVVKL